jgi:hypothetical protein
MWDEMVMCQLSTLHTHASMFCEIGLYCPLIYPQVFQVVFSFTFSDLNVVRISHLAMRTTRIIHFAIVHLIRIFEDYDSMQFSLSSVPSRKSGNTKPILRLK